MFTPNPAAHSLTQAPSHAACPSAFPVSVLLEHFSLCFALMWQSSPNFSPIQTTAVFCAASNRSTRGPQPNCGNRHCLNLTCVQICSLVWNLFFEINLPAISQNVPFDILKIQTLINPTNQHKAICVPEEHVVPYRLVCQIVELSNSPTHEGTHITVPSSAMEAQRGSRGTALFFL